MNQPPRRPRTVLAMTGEVRDALLSAEVLKRLTEVADVDPDLVVTDFFAEAAAGADIRFADALAEAEVLLTGWGCPPLTADALARMPRLRMVAHAAGSVKGFVTEDAWLRGLIVSSAADINALPVAEYTLAAIIMANKRVLPMARAYREHQGGMDILAMTAGSGNYQRTVGVVGASRIGRRVIELLRPLDLEVLVYDPYLSSDESQTLGVIPVPLDELIARSDVVTVHAPDLPETRGMFDAARLAALRDGATLINTARGALVDTAALTAELASGRINAVLDVTEPDHPPTGSPLYTLPNVLLTPHIAGSLGTELHRVALDAIAEIERYARGAPLRRQVRRELLARTA